MTDLSGHRVAIANRGEIAIRIATTCRRLAAVPVLLVGQPDAESLAARQIGHVVILGEAGAELDVERVVNAARDAGCTILHPGYGFLSERAEIAEACAAAGISFAGPDAATLRLCGDKLATRAAAAQADVPLLPASPPLDEDPASWPEAARAVGYPLLVKPAGAGGGRGLRRVAAASELADAIAASRRESAAAGGGTQIYLERQLEGARHVEVQIAADPSKVLVVGDRDCSLQRRNQKVIEEAPAPGLSDEIRSRLHQSARRLAQAVGLHGIATCEFLLGRDGTLAFLEINPRIQVEHPVTEQVTGIDLVEWQLLLATGELLPLTDDPTPRAHAIEARVYAEDPWKSFFPAPGTLATVAWPSGPRIRVDAGYASGDQVPAEYDSLLAKIIASGPDRDAALATLQIALSETIVAGVATNLPWLNDLLANPAFRAGQPTTQTANTVTPTLPDRRPALLAAVAQTLDQSEAGANATDPWSSIGPFRLAGSTPLTFHGEDWEERVTIRRGAHAIEIVDADQATPLRWWRDDAGVWTVVAGEVTARFAVVRRNPGELEISGQGGRWLIRPGPRPTISASVGPRLAAGSDGVVRAPIPARVLRLHTGVGDSVERGQTLVTLSAMKMELACEAPVTGVVEIVSCAVDDQVKAGQTLLRVEPARLP